MKEITTIAVFFNTKKVGTIGLTSNYCCAFEYDADYLATGVSISPYQLPLKNEVFVAKRTPFQGNFGVFDDALPDGWGNLILDRYLESKGMNPKAIAPAMEKLFSGQWKTGAIPELWDGKTAERIVEILMGL